MRRNHDFHLQLIRFGIIRFGLVRIPKLRYSVFRYFTRFGRSLLMKDKKITNVILVENFCLFMGKANMSTLLAVVDRSGQNTEIPNTEA